MDVVELIFKKYLAWKKRNEPNENNADTVCLQDLRYRLTLLACAMSGHPIELITAESVGGWRGNQFYLPAEINEYHDRKLNFKYYLYRVLFLCKQKELKLNWRPDEKSEKFTSEQMAQQNAHFVLDALAEEYENFTPLYNELSHIENKSWLYGKWMVDNTLIAGEELQHIAPLLGDDNDQKDEITTELEANPVDEVITVQHDREKQEEFMITHNFEKIETAEEFDDIWRDFDGDDSLEDDLDALQDINMKHTVRVDDVVHSVYRAEFTGNLTIAQSKELKENGYYYEYPEWHFKQRNFIENHCKVYPLLFRGKDISYAQRIIGNNKNVLLKLKKMLASIQNEMKRIRRVTDGDEFALDEVIDAFVDIRAGKSPNEKLYNSKRKRKADLSILFLIDLSLSGDSYVAGHKVIDIEKEAVILLGEAFSEYDIDFQVDGFFSKTRNFCHYVTLKHFDDKWNRGKVNIGGISPMGFTRIGPAMRHAGFLLEKRPSKKKWVILLSDGKPNDYDQYGGQYGVKDINHTVRELYDMDIGTYALAIEQQAKYYLPQMFGINHYRILTLPEMLPESIMHLYKKIANT